MKLNTIVVTLTAMGLCALAPAVFAKTATTTNNHTTTPAQKAQIESVVHNYLVQNPEVIVEGLQVYQQKQYDQARKSMEKTQAIIPKYVDQLFHEANDPMAGNPQGQVTITEFFDYQCPHCVAMTTVIDSLIAENPNLRVIFKEFPIRGAVSDFAAKAALAAKLQGKYFEFHKALMAAAGQNLTQDSVLNVAKSVDLDVAKLKTDMNSSEVQQQIKATHKLAQNLGIIGTPALFIAKTNVTDHAPATAITFIPGQIDKDQLQAIITKINPAQAQVSPAMMNNAPKAVPTAAATGTQQQQKTT